MDCVIKTQFMLIQTTETQPAHPRSLISAFIIRHLNVIYIILGKTWQHCLNSQLFYRWVLWVTRHQISQIHVLLRYNTFLRNRAA